MHHQLTGTTPITLVQRTNTLSDPTPGASLALVSFAGDVDLPV